MSLASASAEKLRRFPCPTCSANLVYDPNNNCLSCPFCGHQEAIPQSAEEIQERSYEDYLQASTDKMGTLAANALEVKCQNCGATVEFTPPQIAGDCPFCGTPIVAQPQVANPLVT